MEFASFPPPLLLFFVPFVIYVFIHSLHLHLVSRFTITFEFGRVTRLIAILHDVSKRITHKVTFIVHQYIVNIFLHSFSMNMNEFMCCWCHFPLVWLALMSNQSFSWNDQMKLRNMVLRIFVLFELRCEIFLLFIRDVKMVQNEGRPTN